MYNTYHQVIDQGKLADLITSMERNGWQGAPLVADGEDLITGSHRYPASIAAGIVASVIDIRDIYPEWETLHAEYDYPTIDSPDYVSALDQLPQSLRDEYGIDVH